MTRIERLVLIPGIVILLFLVSYKYLRWELAKAEDYRDNATATWVFHSMQDHRNLLRWGVTKNNRIAWTLEHPGKDAGWVNYATVVVALEDGVKHDAVCIQGRPFIWPTSGDAEGFHRITISEEHILIDDNPGTFASNLQETCEMVSK